MSQANKDATVKLVQAIGRGDVDTIKSLVTEDMTIVTTGSSAISGTHTYADLMCFATAFPKIAKGGIEIKVLRLTAEENCVACEAQGRSTLINGAAYDNQYHFLMLFRDGRIYQMREYMDTKLVDAVLMPVLAAGQ